MAEQSLFNRQRCLDALTQRAGKVAIHLVVDLVLGLPIHPTYCLNWLWQQNTTIEL